MFNPKKIFILVCAVFGFLFITNGVPFIYSDGIYYFHVAKSFIDHGTVASPIRPEYWDYREHAIAYYSGNYVEVVSPGTSLILMPGLEVAKILRTSETTYNDYFMAFNGNTLAEGIAVLVTAMIFALATIILIYKLLRELRFSQKIAIFSTFATYASSFAVWYVFLSPAFTHTYEMFFMALSLWAFSKFRNTNLSKYIYILSVALSFLVLIRPVFAVVIVVFGLYFLVKKQIKNLLKFAVTGIPFALIELWYNYVSYGNALSTGYTEIRGEMFNLSTPNQLNVLFSQYRGWFVYSPIFLICIIGLVWLWNKSKAWAVINLLIIALIIGIYGFWPAWWGGGTYGQRFLILLVPNAAIGLAYLLTRLSEQRTLRKIVVGLCVIAVSWSLLLTLLYRFTPVAQLRPASDSFGNMAAGDRYTPIDMIDYHLNLIKNATSLSGYLNSVIHSGNGGNSLLVVGLGISDIAFRIDDREIDHPQMFMIGPPIMRQPIPSEIDFYMVDRRTQQIYQGQIKEVGLNESVGLDCTTSCESTSSKLAISSAKNAPATLPVTGYDAIALENSSVDLYFAKTFNVQFKGNEIHIAADQQFFPIP